jgi:hypothetical protein
MLLIWVLYKCWRVPACWGLYVNIAFIPEGLLAQFSEKSLNANVIAHSCVLSATRNILRVLFIDYIYFNMASFILIYLCVNTCIDA